MNDAIPIKLWLLLIVAAGLISLYCIIHLNLRYRRAPVSKRLLWSILLILPFLGPLLYGALFQRIHPQSGDPGYAGGWAGDGGVGFFGYHSDSGHSGGDCGGGDCGGGGGGDGC